MADPLARWSLEAAPQRASIDPLSKWGLDTNEDWREREARENAAAVQRQDPGTTEIRGTILPLSRNVETGRLSPAVPGVIYDPSTLPGDVFTGKVDPNSDEGGRRALGFALGTLPSNVARGARARPGAPEPNIVPPDTVLPATLDIKGMAQGLYKEAKEAGVKIKPQAFNKLAYGLRHLAESERVNPTLHQGSYAGIRDIYANRVVPKRQDAMSPVTGVVPKPPSKTFSIEEIDTLRRNVNTAKKGHAPEKADDRRIAGLVSDRIDEWLDTLTEADIASGDHPQAALSAIKRARPLWARYRKAELLDELKERALDKVGANYSAAGLQTALRQEFKSIRRNPSQFRRFSKQEQGVIKSLIRGASFENALRYLGKFDPLGGSSMQTLISLVVGHGLGGPAGNLALGTAGFFANRASTRMSSNKLNKLNALVRRGYDEEGANY